MIKLNDSASAPLRFILENVPVGYELKADQSRSVCGQFYNSKDKQYHLAFYVPCEIPPNVYLCGEKHGNFSPSRSEGWQRKGACCPACVEKLRELSRLDEKEFREFGYF